MDRWRYTLDQPTVQANDQPSVHARPAERARNPWFCDGNHVLISYFLIENQVSASIFHTKTEGCRRWACDLAPSVRQTKTMAGGTEKRHRTMVFERKFMIPTEFLTKQKCCEPPKAPLDQSSRTPILYMLYDRGIVTGRGLSKDDDFENVGRPAAEANADLGSPSDRQAIAATCPKVPTGLR